MKTLIIEDEAAIAAGLKSLLVCLKPGLEVLGPVADTVSAAEVIRQHPDLDLIFADIRLEDGYSFDLFDNVETDAAIVFTTAFDEYALKAFEYNCIDYILKPYERKDLDDTFSKFEKHGLRTRIADARTTSSSLSEKYRNKIEIHRADSSIIVDVKDICYAEYEYGNIKVCCRNGHSGNISRTLTSLQLELNPAMFMRISRTAIISISDVSEIKSTLGRGKILVISTPLYNKEFHITQATAKELKKRLL